MKGWMLTIVAGLFFLLAVQVGVTAAATGTSGASASEALQGKVRILGKGTLTGPPVRRFRSRALHPLERDL